MRKTETYFLRVLSSSEDLAPPVADYLHQQHPSLCPRMIIVAPSQEYAVQHRNPRALFRFGQRITPERTLIFGDDRLVVIEQHPDATLSDIMISFDQIVRVEWAMVLLYAYVRFTWVAEQGLKTLKVEYNAVGDEIMRAALEQLRQRLPDPDADAAIRESTDLAEVARTLPLKFKNYLREARVSGQPVRQIIFQPGIQRSPIFWRSQAAEGCTLVLTSAELIVLEEARDWLNFGVVIRCLPLRTIQSVRFEPQSDRVGLRLNVGDSSVGEDITLTLSDLNARHLSEGLQRYAPFIPVEWMGETDIPRVKFTRSS